MMTFLTRHKLNPEIPGPRIVAISWGMAEREVESTDYQIVGMLEYEVTCSKHYAPDWSTRVGYDTHLNN